MKNFNQVLTRIFFNFIKYYFLAVGKAEKWDFVAIVICSTSQSYGPNHIVKTN